MKVSGSSTSLMRRQLPALFVFAMLLAAYGRPFIAYRKECSG